MPASGQNEGFHVLDDFVCQAIPAPTISPAGPDKQGRNEGMFVTEELVFEAGKTLTEPPGPVVLDATLRSEANRLAALIAASSDPDSNTARFQKLLLDELANLRRSDNKA
jgi:hypothetical protein